MSDTSKLCALAVIFKLRKIRKDAVDILGHDVKAGLGRDHMERIGRRPGQKKPGFAQAPGRASKRESVSLFKDLKSRDNGKILCPSL
jgi:hypothetical protein